ncbi:hypothetical protein C0J52_27675, partial [Blattella germanica]
RGHFLFGTCWQHCLSCCSNFGLTATHIFEPLFFEDRSASSPAPFAWPPRSPDLTTPDNALWGFIKEHKKYSISPNTGITSSCEIRLHPYDSEVSPQIICENMAQNSDMLRHGWCSYQCCFLLLRPQDWYQLENAAIRRCINLLFLLFYCSSYTNTGGEKVMVEHPGKRSPFEFPVVLAAAFRHDRRTGYISHFALVLWLLSIIGLDRSTREPARWLVLIDLNGNPSDLLLVKANEIQPQSIVASIMTLLCGYITQCPSAQASLINPNYIEFLQHQTIKTTSNVSLSVVNSSNLLCIYFWILSQ